MNTEPVVLLPVRIETRSDAGGSVLRVRIFPDDIHVDALDPGISPDERAAGEAYWRAAWAPPPDGAEPSVDDWAELVRRVGPRRAAWVATELTPTNLDQAPGEPPIFPVRPARTNAPAAVRTLPGRFQAFAFQGEDVSTGQGEPVIEELQVGLPTEPTGKPLEFKNGVPIVDDALRWLVDFERAKEVGMGLVVPLRQPGRRVDRLVVLGVRDDLDPLDASQRLGALLRAHAYTDGAAFVEQGSPTNNTDTDRTAWSRRVPPAAPLAGIEPPVPGTNADVLAAVLDIEAQSLTALDGWNGREQPHARAMATALWATTWEVLFDKLTGPATPGRSFTHGRRDDLREHAIEYVRGRGPVPAVRIGRQPYGVLPTTAFAPHGFISLEGSTADDGLGGFLQHARTLWRAGVANVPTVMEGDLERDLPEILGSSPVLSGLRVRSLTKVTVCYRPLPGLLGAEDNCESQSGIDQIAREFLGFEPTETGSNGLLGSATRVLAVPLVKDADEGAANGDADYIEKLLRDPATAGDAQSVLQALLGLAAAIEADEWQKVAGDEGVGKLRSFVGEFEATPLVQQVRGALEVVEHARFSGQAAGVVDEAATMIAREIGTLDRGAVAAAYPIDAVRPQSVIAAASRRDDSMLTDVSLTMKLAGEVFRVNARNRDFRDALRVLHGLGLEERALLLSEVLDTASHRLDAWQTSLATRRLAWQRANGVRGVVLGAYGFVRNIEIVSPAALDDLPGDLEGTVFADPRDGGYIHAPSLDHAATAGVLRSARLTHDPGDSGSPALDIDLSSTRVRQALHIVDGVRQGQPLGALLGYRLERWLHDRSKAGLALDRYIYVLRSIAPLAAGKLTDSGTEPVPVALESVSATNVVDGVRLLEIYRMDGGAAIAKRLNDGPDEATLQLYIGTWPAVSAADRDAVLAAIGELERVHDAVADLLLAEAVHQLIQGNTARAAAALDAAGGGDGVPPDPHVIRTPRSGTAFTHRLLVLTPPFRAGDATGWNDNAPRSLAHPRLEAWARAQLGDADGVVLSAQPELTLAGRGLCALDMIGDAGPALLERVRMALGDPAFAPLTVRPAAWGRKGDRLLLAEAQELARSLRDLLGTARPVAGATLAQPDDAADPTRAMELDELEGRATAARDGLEQARKELADAVEAGVGIAGRLAALYAWGVRPPATLASYAADDLDRIGAAVVLEPERRVVAANAALEQAKEARDAADQARLAAAAAPTEPERAAAREAAASADAHRLRSLGDVLVAVFGPGLPALPIVRPPAAADGLTAALGVASPDDGADVRPWLSRWASVRQGVARHAETLLFREALGRRQRLRAVQLPKGAFPSWVGLELPRAVEPPKGPVSSLVVELPPGADPTGVEELSGFVVDEWVDVVPRRIALPNRDDPGQPGEIAAVATTAAAVNAQTSSARPPQAVLLAVTPDGQPWTVEKLLAVVEDTFRLAQERAVTLERVPLAPRILPALYVNDWSLQGEPVLQLDKLWQAVSVRAAIPTFVKG